MAPQAQVAENFRPRRSFGKIKKVVEIPNLIEIQRRSYDDFLQRQLGQSDRRPVGLQGVFKSVFPIKGFNENAELDFVDYSIGEPKFDIDECHQRGNNYAAPLKVTVHLVIYDHDEETGFSGQNYFPEGMARRNFYKPAGRGAEARVKERLEFWAAERAKRGQG